MQPVIGAAILPGFSDPVMQSQAMFRVVMSALAEPGIWRKLPDEITPPAGLPLPAALALLTLADYETPVWLPQSLGSGVGDWLRFHCNCPLAKQPSEAVFAVLSGDGDETAAIGVADFAAGTDPFPDRSTTLIVVTESQTGGIAVDLTGPGIESARRIAPAGVSLAFWNAVKENAGRYPLGVDLLFADTTHILGLPRSTQIGGL